MKSPNRVLKQISFEVSFHLAECSHAYENPFLVLGINWGEGRVPKVILDLHIKFAYLC